MFDQTSSTQRSRSQSRRSNNSAGIFSYKEVNIVDPRDKGLWYMLRSTICPNLTLKSFITIVTIINVTVFVCQVFIDGIRIPGKFLEVSSSLTKGQRRKANRYFWENLRRNKDQSPVLEKFHMFVSACFF
jgi:hypothetical protein